MKYLSIIILLLATTLIYSCGQSQADIAKEQAKIDSIKRVTEEQTKLKIENKSALQDSLTKIKSALEQADQRLIQFRADLATANDEMGRIKEFHWGRSDGARSEQIRVQTIKIGELQEGITKLQTFKNEWEKNYAQIQSQLTTNN
jgi:hypothetical protein